MSYLGDDILHVAARVVCAIIIAEPIEHRLRLKLVLVCDWNKFKSVEIKLRLEQNAAT